MAVIFLNYLLKHIPHITAAFTAFYIKCSVEFLPEAHAPENLYDFLCHWEKNWQYVNTLPAWSEILFRSAFPAVCPSPSVYHTPLVLFMAALQVEEGSDVRIKKKRLVTQLLFKEHQTKKGRMEAGFHSVSALLLCCAKHLKLMFIVLKTIISRVGLWC